MQEVYWRMYLGKLVNEIDPGRARSQSAMQLQWRSKTICRELWAGRGLQSDPILKLGG